MESDFQEIDIFLTDDDGMTDGIAEGSNDETDGKTDGIPEGRPSTDGIVDGSIIYTTPEGSTDVTLDGSTEGNLELEDTAVGFFLLFSEGSFEDFTMERALDFFTDGAFEALVLLFLPLVPLKGGAR